MRDLLAEQNRAPLLRRRLRQRHVEEVVDPRADGVLPRLRGVDAVGQLRQRRAQVSKEALGHDAVEIVLRPVVAVHQRVVHSGTRADISCRGTFEPLLHKHLRCRREDGLARLLSVASFLSHHALLL